MLKEEELERDSQLLQATLVNKGYIDARVAAPEVVYDPDGIRVIFRVREGDRYKLGEVGFSGDLIDTREKLLAQTKLDDLAEDGEYFNLETMQEDIKKLTPTFTGITAMPSRTSAWKPFPGTRTAPLWMSPIP